LFFLFSLLSHGFFSLSKHFLVKLISSLEQEVGKELSRVLRNFFAQLNESLSEVRHDVVHQVLTDRLRAFIKKVTFVLTNVFKPNGLLLVTNLLGSGLFSSDAGVLSSLSGVAVMLFLFPSDERTNFVFFNGLLGDLLLSLISSFTFFTLFLFRGSLREVFLTSLHSSELLCIGFGFVKFLKEGVIGSSDEVETARLSILLTEIGDHLESFLVILDFINAFKLPNILLSDHSLKESLDVGFTSVSLSVRLKSPIHFLIIPVRFLNLISREVLHSLFQEGIISL
jgi:hypothetical protein